MDVIRLDKKYVVNVNTEHSSYIMNIHICLSMVFYGWRIRIGCTMENTHPLYYSYDICAGDKAGDIERIYNSFKGVLEANLEHFGEFGCLPLDIEPPSDIKPITRHPHYERFMNSISHFSPAEYTQISEVDLLEWRREIMGDLFVKVNKKKA